MKRAYPAIKFVPPRPTGKPAVPASEESFTPPPREAASVSPAIAKRKRPTTQSWKGPRRRLDPPSPLNALLSKASTARKDEARRVAEGREGRVAPPVNKINYRSSRPEKTPSSAISRESAADPATASAAVSAVPSKATPYSPATRKVYSRSKPLVMVAETPRRPTAAAKPSSRRPTSFGHQQAVGLRIPDTPDPAVAKRERNVEVSRSTGRESEREVRKVDSDGSTCSSSLSSPPIGLPSEGAQAGATAAAGVGGNGTTPAFPEAPPSSSEESDAGSESPDLLRSYTMGAKGKRHQPGQNAAAVKGSVSCSGGGATRGVAMGHWASEASDTGSDSPDLLRGCGSAHAELEMPEQANTLDARVTTAGTTSSDRPRELPDAIESGAEPERTQKTERGAGTTHPQQRESGLPRSRGLSTEGLKPAPEPISSLQTTVDPSKSQPRQAEPHPFSASLGIILDARAHDPASSMAESSSWLPPPAQLGDGGTSCAVAKRRSVAVKESVSLDTRDGGHKPPPEDRVDYGTGAEGDSWRDVKGGASLAPPSGSSPSTQSAGSGTADGEEKAQGGTIPHESPASAATLLSSARTSDHRLEGERGTYWRLQSRGTKAPSTDIAATTASGSECCAASTLVQVPGASLRVSSVKPGPARSPAAKEGRPASDANDHSTKTKMQTSPQENMPRRPATSLPNPYDTAPKDAASAPAGVPNPYAGGSNSRVRAAPRCSSIGVCNTRDDVKSVSRVIAQGTRVPVPVPNPYGVTGTISRAAASATGISTGVPNCHNAIGTTPGFPAALERVPTAAPRSKDAASATVRVSACAEHRSADELNPSRDPILPAPRPASHGQPTESSSMTNTRLNAPTRREHVRPSRDGGASTSDENSSETPPEVRFEVARQQLYKNPRSATTGRGGRGRGRGRGRGGARGANGGGKRGSAAPRPAQDALLGVWRNKPSKKKGERGTRFYITRSGQKLTGREATTAAAEDQKAIKRGLGPVAKDRSTIMRMGQCKKATSSVPPSPSSTTCREDCCDAENQLHEDALKLETYEMPEQLVDSYAKRGIRRLFRWQAHCLRVDDGKPLGGGNLVYSAPTSGGKTLVAELLLLRALLKHSGTMALLVVPYVALALEKRDYFRDVWSPLQLNVQAYHGGEGGDESDMEGVNVAICTIEKANSIVNRLAEEKRLEGLSAVVVDEMHLIGDKSRGFLLELMLTKQRLLCPKSTQLICLSATLPNIECLAKWLDASLYRTEYRPVHLRHFVCEGRAVYRPSASRHSTNGGGQGGEEERLEKVVGGGIKKVGDTSSILDPDGVVDLVKDALARDMSVLVFCSTKKWCQQTANLLAKEVLSDRGRAAERASAAVARNSRVVRESESSGEGKMSLVGFVPATSVVPKAPASDTSAVATMKSTNPHSRVREGNEVLQDVGAKRAARTATITGKEQGTSVARPREVPLSPTPASVVREKLRETPVGLDADLSYLVGAGIAFHHSGLVVEERAILEDAFRQGSIRVLVATSTLAAGVNLPAHRVIIRSPSIGIGLLDSTRYHQMAGRSGRAGVSRGEEGGKAAREVDTACGESFLIIPKNVKFTLTDASKLISAPLPKLESALRDAKGGGLERALLEVVVSKTVTSSAAARSFCSRTLLAVQIEEGKVHEACASAMEYLLRQNFIVKRGSSGEGCPDYDVAPTQLGRATFFSGLSPSAAVDVFQSLDKACQNFAVASDLHALVLVTPLDGIEPNWRRLREEYLACSEDDPVRVVGELIGIELGVLVSAAGHTGPKYGQRTYDISRGSSRRTVDLQPYRRLYGAMLLQQAVEEVPVRNMAARLGIERGTLQSLQKEASVFCGMVVCFCRHLQWHELANVLYSFQDRLGYSAKPELLPLVRLSRDLPPFRARALLEAGYPSPLELATADAGPVADVLLRCAPFRSAGWDESVEQHRVQQANRLAQNVIRLARMEVMRQIRRNLVSSTPAV